jgi:hypothetical protein
MPTSVSHFHRAPGDIVAMWRKGRRASGRFMMGSLSRVVSARFSLSPPSRSAVTAGGPIARHRAVARLRADDAATSVIVRRTPVQGEPCALAHAPACILAAAAAPHWRSLAVCVSNAHAYLVIGIASNKHRGVHKKSPPCSRPIDATLERKYDAPSINRD